MKNGTSLLSEASKVKYSFKGVQGRIIYLAFSYFFIFLSELTFLSLVTQLYDQMDYKYLGNISLFIIYTFFGIASIFAAYFVEKNSLKWVQFTSSLILTGFISVGILVSACADQDDPNFICQKPAIYTIVILVTALAGVTGAIIWTAQSGFMIFYCQLYPEKEGKLIGMFWGIFQLSQGLGQVVAFVVLKYFSQTIFFIFLTGIAGLGALLLFFYQDVPKVNFNEHNFAVSLSSQGSHAFSVHTRTKIKQFKKMFMSLEMRPYFSFFFMNGVVVAFYSTFLYTIIQSSLGYSLDSSALSSSEKQDINLKTTYVFTSLGFSEVFAAFVCSKLMDKVDYKKVGYFSNIIVQLAIFFSFLAYFLNNYALCFVCAFLWGFADCFYITVASYLCQIRFKAQPESFCIFRLTQGVGVMVTVLISIFMSNLDIYFFIFVVLAFQVTSSTLMLNSFEEQETQFDLVIKEQLQISEVVSIDHTQSANKQVPS